MSEIERAAQILREGGLVAFPTETVYGLGADALNPGAVRSIFAAKHRPANHPVIVHLEDAGHLPDWARTIPPAAERLTERFWPGPLTLVLKRAAGVIDEVTGGQDTVGLRVPSHPLAQKLLKIFGGGIAAPSANRFGHISPTTAEHVREELGNAVDLILDGGACDVGIESTILDLSSDSPTLLRPGRIGIAEIESTIGLRVMRGVSNSPRVPGMLAAHYAPRLPLLLVAVDSLDRVVREQAVSGTVAVLARRPRPPDSCSALWQPAATDAQAYAHDLYSLLRDLDHSSCALIVVEAPPEEPEWTAVHDRLVRAAAGSGTGLAFENLTAGAADAT